MSLHFTEYKVPPKWWDKKVQKNNGFATSITSWGGIYSHLGIGRNRYFEIQENKKTVALFTLYEHIIGGEYLLRIPKLFRLLIQKLSICMSFSFHLQPVFVGRLSEEKKFLVCAYIIKNILQLAKKEGKNIIPADIIMGSSLEYAQKLSKKYQPHTEICGTARMSLPKNPEEWFQNLPKEVKNVVRKAQKMEITIKKLTPDNLHLYYANLLESWKEHHVAVCDIEYYHAMMHALHEHVGFYVAQYKGKIVAGLGVYYTEKTAFEFSMYATPYGKKHNIPGSYMLKYHILNQAIESGCTYYDVNMIGVPEGKILTEKILQINHFKLKWGGSLLYGVKVTKLHPLLTAVRAIKLRILGI